MLAARWYTREEQPIRQVFWFAGTPVFGIFGGLLGYAVGKIHNPTIASWRLLFIIFGCVTMVWGCFLYFFFPGDPSRARFLKPEERIAASAIVRLPYATLFSKEHRPNDITRRLPKGPAHQVSGNGIKSEKPSWIQRHISSWQ